MDKPKSIVMKSKSSNSAITTKSEPRKRKKSLSDAEFQPLILKKRGVYVEKKTTKMSIKDRDLSPVGQSLPTPRNPASPNDIPPSSPRPKPRVGRKRFLASVLKILSQSTTGTQYPDHDDTEKLKKQERTKSRHKKKKEYEIISEDATSRRKPRYRSKILNEEHKNADLEQLVVLQSTKEITHTPSNYSERSDLYKDPSTQLKEPDGIKWADISLKAPKKSLDVPIYEDNKEKEQETPAKPIDTKVKVIDKDPSTLIATVPKKDDKKFYKFFYDLLETTFSVYNVKTEFNTTPPSAFSSKVNFEIDETVAKKLAVQKTKDCTAEDNKEQPSKFYCIKPDDKDFWDDKQLLEHFQPKALKRARPISPTKSIKRRRKLKLEPEYRKKLIPTTASLSTPKKTSMKKERKKTFINLLKEQLQMEDDAFEEPQNFYQALKIIARNKRRCQKSIHFAESKKSSEGDVHVCQFKRRKLFSADPKSGKRSSYNPESDALKSMKSFHRNTDHSMKKRNIFPVSINDKSEDNLSEHSLEVFGFDYEPVSKKPAFKDFPSFPPSATSSVQDYNINAALLMKFSNSTTSSAIENAHIRAQHGLRSLSALLNK